MPKIDFESTVYDFGAIGLGKATIRHRFEFRNSGSAPLHILKVRKTCSCIVDQVSKDVVQPNEEGFVQVALKLDTIAIQEKSGLVERSVLVESNDPEHPLVKLTLRGTREKNHFFYPSQIMLGPVFIHQSESKQIYYLPKKDIMAMYNPKVTTSAYFLEAKLDKKIFLRPPLVPNLARVTSDFDFALSESAYPREGYEITVTLQPTAPAGEFLHYIILETGDPVDSQILVRVLADIREPLDIAPRRVFLGLVQKGEQLSRRIIISSRDEQAFTIHSASSDINGIIPNIKKIAPSRWQINLELNPQKISTGDFKGLLHIATDFPGMESFTIGVYGRYLAFSQ